MPTGAGSTPTVYKFQRISTVVDKMAAFSPVGLVYKFQRISTVVDSRWSPSWIHVYKFQRISTVVDQPLEDTVETGL